MKKKINKLIWIAPEDLVNHCNKICQRVKKMPITIDYFGTHLNCEIGQIDIPRKEVWARIGKAHFTLLKPNHILKYL